MKRKAKIAIIIILIITIISILIFLQYYAATQLKVSMQNSKIIERTDKGTFYNIDLELENKSFMILNVGKTDFVISAEGENLGSGILEQTIVPAYGKINVETPFVADNKVLDKYEKVESPSLKLDGVVIYNLGITSLNLPFTYYPTPEEARQFIHGQ